MNDGKSYIPEFTAILIVSLIAFLSFFGFSIQRIFVPLFAKEELKATVEEVGLVASISGLTGVLLSIPSGLISDKLGRGQSTLVGSFFLKLYKPPASRSELVSLSLVKTVVRNRNMWVGLSLIFPAFLLLGGTQPFIPLYSRLLKFDNTLIGILFAIQFCVTALSRIPSGLILDKVKKEFILGFPAVLLASILVALLALVPEPLYLIGTMSLVGCGLGIANPVSSVMIVKSSGIATRGLVMSLATTFRSIGFTIGPATVAIIVSSIGESTTGYQFGFSALGALAICSSIIAYIQYRILPKLDKISNF